MAKTRNYELRTTSFLDGRHWGVWEYGRDPRFGVWALEPRYSRKRAQNALDKLVIKEGQGHE